MFKKILVNPRFVLPAVAAGLVAVGLTDPAFAQTTASADIATAGANMTEIGNSLSTLGDDLETVGGGLVGLGMAVATAKIGFRLARRVVGL